MKKRFLMNRLNYYLICLTVFMQSCYGQISPKMKIYNEDFKWTITIPENFEKLSNEQWSKMQNKGAAAIEKTYDGKIINQTTILFVFKSGQTNYFESNYQPYDITTDGEYLENCNAVNEMLYETFKSQMPNIKIDTTKTVEKIDHLEFQNFKMKVEYPNKMILTILMYNRLFENKEFTVNIMYLDDKKGEQMINAWKASTFNK